MVNSSMKTVCSMLLLGFLAGTIFFANVSHATDIGVPLHPKPEVIKIHEIKSQSLTAESSKLEVNNLRKHEGVLVYASDTATYSAKGFSSSWQSYLVVQKVAGEKLDSKKKNAASFSHRYIVDIPPQKFLYDPKLSPNGKTLSLKVGSPFTGSKNYNLYIWDFVTDALKLVAKDIEYNDVFWSPDNLHIAYLKGSNVGNFQLCIYDVTKDKTIEVRSNILLPYSISWLSDQKILYSELAKRSSLQQANLSFDVKIKSNQIDIQEFSLLNKKSKSYIYNGYKPFSSPDGKNVVYLKPANTLSNEKESSISSANTHPLALILSRENTVGKLFKRGAESLMSVIWDKDSKSFVAIYRTFENVPQDKGSLVQVIFEQWNTESNLKNTISYKYFAMPGTDLTEDKSLFKPLKISKDGNSLLFTIFQFEDSPNNGLFLKSLDLKTGKITNLCRVKTVRGLDWHSAL